MLDLSKSREKVINEFSDFIKIVMDCELSQTKEELEMNKEILKLKSNELSKTKAYIVQKIKDFIIF